MSKIVGKNLDLSRFSDRIFSFNNILNNPVYIYISEHFPPKVQDNSRSQIKGGGLYCRNANDQTQNCQSFFDQIKVVKFKVVKNVIEGISHPHTNN